jgi:hypothetical protein
MSKAASETSLQSLHSLVADVLAEQLSEGDASPQLLAQAIKFLKDNGVEPAKDVDNAKLTALSDKIKRAAEAGTIDDLLQ